MTGNRRLARHMADAAFGETRRQLTYKAQQRGCYLGVVEHWFPSSKQCWACGQINQLLTLSDRSWHCAGCGTLHDRDENAAKNILAESERVATPEGEILLSTAGVAGVGCGEGSAGRSHSAPAKLSSAKQQVKHNPAIRQSYA